MKVNVKKLLALAALLLLGGCYGGDAKAGAFGQIDVVSNPGGMEVTCFVATDGGGTPRSIDCLPNSQIGR